MTDIAAESLPCDTYECADRLWCIQRRMCKSDQEGEDGPEIWDDLARQSVELIGEQN